MSKSDDDADIDEERNNQTEGSFNCIVEFAFLYLDLIILIDLSSVNQLRMEIEIMRHYDSSY